MSSRLFINLASDIFEELISDQELVNNGFSQPTLIFIIGEFSIDILLTNEHIFVGQWRRTFKSAAIF